MMTLPNKLPPYVSVLACFCIHWGLWLVAKPGVP